MFTHCSPSSKWVPGGNIGEIQAAKKGTGHPTSHADGSGKVSSLPGTPLRTKVYGTTFTYELHTSGIIISLSLPQPVILFAFFLYSYFCAFRLRIYVFSGTTTAHLHLNSMHRTCHLWSLCCSHVAISSSNIG